METLARYRFFKNQRQERKLAGKIAMSQGLGAKIPLEFSRIPNAERFKFTGGVIAPQINNWKLKAIGYT
jgi:hypothetical protein